MAKTIENWNFTLLSIMQSLLGAISPNFRMIELGEFEGKWIIKFILEKESDEDRDEIKNIIDQFEALQSCVVEYQTEIIIENGAIAWPPAPSRVIYKRKE